MQAKIVCSCNQVLSQLPLAWVAAIPVVGQLVVGTDIQF